MYAYQYNGLNRLVNASYVNKDNPIFTDALRETMFYDKNGNIKQLQRFGKLNNDESVGGVMVDNLLYSYATNSKNQLKKVVDLSNSSIGFVDDTLNAINEAQDVEDDYQYDLNGNMISDQNKHITSITYNHLNLPKVVTFEGSNKSIEYLYDATGVKLRKSVSNLNVTTNTVEISKTEYLGGFQYTSKTGLIGGMALQFIPHAEGYVNNIVINNQNRYNYIYNYTDHLGNIRLSYTFDEQTGTVQPIDEHHYYPFGLELINIENTAKMAFKMQASTNVIISGVDEAGTRPRLVQVANSGYQYQFQEQEFQDELGLNWYSFKYRNYDPSIARWVVQDPVVHHSMSPYNAFDNNPVFWADPSGADPIYNKSTGQYVINGDVVSFWEALAYANNGGNADGKNNNTPKTNQSSDPPWKYNKIKNNYLNNGNLIIYSEMKAGKDKKRERWKDLLGSNTCSIRLSYALNMSGYTIPSHITSQGRYTYTSNINSNYDYILGADEMGNYLSQQLSGYHLIQSGIITSDSQLKDFMNEVESWKGLKGIVYVDAINHNEYGASGHVDLIYNDFFGDASFYSFGWYRDNDLDNYIKNRFKSELQISIWVLEGTK